MFSGWRMQLHFASANIPIGCTYPTIGGTVFDDGSYTGVLTGNNILRVSNGAGNVYTFNYNTMTVTHPDGTTSGMMLDTE
jgi:hypothetical protein